MQNDELLGGGLDIDGWNILKHEPGRTVNDLIDKSYVHRQHLPLVVKCLLPRNQRQEVHEIVVGTLESKSSIDPPWIAEHLKRSLDLAFGASWHVIVGEDFTFQIDYEERALYYILYASYAILAWKCGSVMPSDVNHIDDPGTKEKLKAILAAKDSANAAGANAGAGGAEPGGPTTPGASAAAAAAASKLFSGRRDVFAEKI